MRILFGFVGGAGHFEPLLPVARAARAAGHAVAFSAYAEMRGLPEAHGFACLPTASDASGPRTRKPLVPVDEEHEDRVLRDVFAGRLARGRTAGVLAAAADWRPDLIVCDETDFGAAVGAERLGIPHATVLVTAAGGFVREEVVGEPIAALRVEHGLPPARPPARLVLSPFPPSIRTVPLPPSGHAIRLGNARREPTPDAVYFTLGTVFNLECGDLFARVLAGLRDLDANVIVTVGHDVDPAELGPQPAHVRVERHVDQAAVLPRCRAVVSHGGSGSVLGALAHGLPSVLLPMGADQPRNARRCVQLGVARVLDAVHATPADVHAAATAVLTEQSYRRAAGRLRDEIARLPGPDEAVPLLEAAAVT